jgi:hypothetical protein
MEIYAIAYTRTLWASLFKKMRTPTLLIIWTLILVSCSNDKPRWTYDDPNNYHPDKIQLESFTFDGLKLKTTKDDLINNLGQPVRQTDRAGTFYQRESRLSKKYDSIVWYNSYIYIDKNKDIRFAVWDNNAVVSMIDFRESNIQIKTSDIILSSKTDLKEIKEKFPTSYDWRNAGINTAKDSFPMDNKLKENDLTWIHLENENGEYIELTFINDRLVFLMNKVTD